MATDATGTPTSLGIPTYNVDADSPSGNGANEMMESIDTLLTNRVIKPSSLASGETAVWNGTTFVRSSTTPLGATSIGTGTPSASNWLRGDGAWTQPPACRAWNSANISIPNATLTTFTFDSENFDTDGMHSTSVNTDRITINTAGIYLITGQVYFEFNATGTRMISILVNGATEIAASEHTTHSNGTSREVASTLWSLAATDYVSMRVYQASGGSLAALGANGGGSTSLSVVRVA